MISKKSDTDAGTKLVHEFALNIKGWMHIGVEGDRYIGMAEDAAEGLGIEPGADTVGCKGMTDGMEVDFTQAALAQGRLEMILHGTRLDILLGTGQDEAGFSFAHAFHQLPKK